MKRIVYVLTNERGKIVERSFLDGPLIFTSEKKAQKVMETEAKRNFSLELKKIVLANYPCLCQYSSFHLNVEFKFIGEFLFTLLCMGSYCYCTLSVLQNMKIAQIDPHVQKIFLMNIFLAGLAVTCIVRGGMKLLKRFFFFLLDVCLWLKYKKENTEGLEIFHVFSPLSLMKIGEMEKAEVEEKSVQGENE